MMKNFGVCGRLNDGLFLGLFALLTSCATTLENHEGAPVTPPPPMAEENKSSDPFASAEKPTEANPSQLAAPVDPFAASPTNTNSAVPNFSGTQPSPPPTAPTGSAGTKEGWGVADPIVAKQGQKKEKVIPTSQELDQAYNQHLADENLKNQKTLREEAMLFPHESGNKQIELGFNAAAFSSLNWNRNRFSSNRQELGTTRPTMGATVSFLYFPIQTGVGNIGLGPTGSYYWTKFVSESKDSMSAVGGKAIYQAQFVRGQLIVPNVVYSIEKVKQNGYKLSSTNPNDTYDGISFTSQSFGGGFDLNLNHIEPDTASKAYAGMGIRKFYLSYAFQVRSSVAQLGELGNGHLVSLKFEY